MRRTNRVIFGVGLMVTGALQFFAAYLVYALAFISPNATTFGPGWYYYAGQITMLIGLLIALIQCKRS